MIDHKNIKTIDGNLFKKMFINGTFNLKNKYKEINNLNVFPIPDGDTGTNMHMTMMEGVTQLKKNKDSSIIKVTKILSDALLFGSKGNSGVILSQFFSGIYDKIKSFKKKNISILEFIDALENGYKKAYKSVVKPVEGTILTVLRESIEKTIKIKNNLTTIKETLQKLLKYAKISLLDTPKLLPILKKSNVVDSGGAGFVLFLEGMCLYLNNQLLNNNEEKNEIKILNSIDFKKNDFLNQNHKLIINTNKKIKYRYCSEFIFKLNSNKFNLIKKKEELSQKNIGDSLVIIKNKDILKIHIHTNVPGDILNNLLNFGNLVKSKIEDMQKQKDSIHQNKKKENINVIAILYEKKIQKIFYDLKVDYLIKKKNPSIKDFEKIIKENKLDNIIILPNNEKTIKKSLELCKNYPQLNIKIIKTNNIGQIYNALLAYDPKLSLDINLKNMNKNIEKNKIVKIISRDIFLKSNKNISEIKNNFMAIFKNIEKYDENIFNLSIKILKEIIDEKNRFLTIFYNKNFETKESIKKIEIFLNQNYKNIEIEKIETKNKEYLYIFLLE
ncbi:DAK2 domain-containing protein [Candidatus Phytoplasma sacchari]|uniref:DAK2 domain-containing protein n=1 Tax=Candidatus Phytoplasma sacchari TaxID=2609813 RepID=A0ABY7M2X9_9MOLU|nr:DAK2 domain-containing protein [Candidatus Phytoplasma sacchari]